MKHPKKAKEQESWWQPGLILFGRLSGWIAGPVIIALIVSHWLEKKYQTGPITTLVLVGVAFILSMFALTHEALKSMGEQPKKKNPTPQTGNNKEAKEHNKRGDADNQ